MNVAYSKIFTAATLCCLLVLAGIFMPGCKNDREKAVFKGLSTIEGLEKHSLEFTKRVEKVCDGIYVAIGFGLANAIMIEGDKGVIIVDTLESIDSARAV